MQSRRTSLDSCLVSSNQSDSENDSSASSITLNESCTQKTSSRDWSVIETSTLDTSLLNSHFGSFSDDFKYFFLNESLLSCLELKAQQVQFELLSTEAQYLNDLYMIKSIFIDKLLLKSIISLSDVTRIFGNLEKLIPIHESLYKRILSCRNTGIFLNISTAFSQDMLSIIKQEYLNYMLNFSDQQSFLKHEIKRNSKLSVFLQYCMLKPECRSLDLASYLLKPIQRVMKYPLLLSSLCKTNESDLLISDTATKLSDLIASINEKKNEIDSIRKLSNVMARLEYHEELANSNSASRRVLIDSTLSRHRIGPLGTSFSQKTYLVLLSDYLIVSNYSKKENRGTILNLIPKKYLLDVRDSSSIQKGDLKFTISYFSPSIGSRNIYFSTPDSNLKDRWVSLLGKFIEPIQNTVVSRKPKPLPSVPHLSILDESSFNSSIDDFEFNDFKMETDFKIHSTPKRSLSYDAQLMVVKNDETRSLPHDSQFSQPSLSHDEQTVNVKASVERFNSMDVSSESEFLLKMKESGNQVVKNTKWIVYFQRFCIILAIVLWMMRYFFYSIALVAFVIF